VEADAWMQAQKEKPRSYAGAVAIVTIWAVVVWLAWRWFGS
jgi:hypothetical protein